MASLTGVSVGKGVRIGHGSEVSLGSAVARRGVIALGEFTHLEPGVLLHPYGGRVELGRNVFIGPYAVVYGHGGVEIGNDTLVSMHCRILSSNHTVPPPGTPIRSQPDIALPTKIGRDVWLGAGVTVLGGVTIGDGCIVGAGGVVTKDLPPGSIAHGVPARVVDRRA
jgi:acetyltransferase-like isoleucine patch superfamily enzyme